MLSFPGTKRDLESLKDMAEISALKNGDQEEWEMVINQYSKNIYNIALNFSKNSEEAADITQEIFIKVYQNINKYKTGHNFTAWLFRVAKNYCIDYWRKNKKYQHRLELDENFHGSEQETPEDTSILKSEKKKLRELIQSLPADIRILIVMRDIQGISYDRIAGNLNLPLGTVKSRINRGRLKLARQFGQEEKNEAM